MNNSYSLNKSPKIAKRLLVLLDMIVVVLTLALSVSALQRHFWTIGLWRPLASCLAHRPLHRHWFSFVAFPLNIATPGRSVADLWMQCKGSMRWSWPPEAELPSCNAGRLNQSTAGQSLRPACQVQWVRWRRVQQAWNRPQATGCNQKSVPRANQAAAGRVTRWWLTSQLNAYFHPVDHKVGQQGAAIDFLQLQNLFLLGGYTQTALRSEFILFLYIAIGDSWRCWYNR